MTSKKAWTISVGAGLLLVVAVFVGVFASGYRFFVVATPSMGTVAPVGSLVAVHARASYEIGEVITYERNNRSYTHRIVDHTDAGFITKGDINGATDALPVQPDEIVGQVTFIGKYLGFAAQALPWILLGCAIVYGLTLMPRVRPSWRWQLRFIGWSLVVTLVGMWLHPWVNMVMLTWVPNATEGVDMHLVNTGIFPVNVLGTILHSGQDAVVTQTVVDAHGKYTVTPSLALSVGWFLVLLAICLVPMVASLLVRVTDDEVESVALEEGVAVVAVADDESIGEAEALPNAVDRTVTRRDRIKVGLIASFVLVCVVVVAIVLQWSTNAAFAAQVTNSLNTTGTRTWFTCQAAETGTTGTKFVWGLTAVGTQDNLDATANTYDGLQTTNSPTAVASTSSPCPRDTQGSLQFKGGTCYSARSTVTTNSVYSEEVWFRVTATGLNGRMMGASDSTGFSAGNWDRHLYMDQTGRMLFGVYVNGSRKPISSPAGTSYADGVWHLAIATSSATATVLYIDGSLVASRADTTGQTTYAGAYWQVGCGQLAGWEDGTLTTTQNYPTNFTGYLRLAAVYDVTLTAQQAKEHYLAGVA